MVTLARRATRGFTIVELLIVLVIAAVLVTLAAGSFRDLLNTQAVKNASYNLFSSLLQARSEAITRNADVTVAPNGASWAQGWTIKVGSSVVANVPATSGITVTGPATIQFGPNGRPTVTDTPFYVSGAFTKSDGTRCVRVTASGRPLIKNGTCA